MRASAAALLVLLALLLAACQGGVASQAAGESPSGEPSVASAAPSTADTPPPASQAPASQAAASQAPAGPALTVASAAAIGDHVVDPQGMTLYIFLNDMQGMSHCIGTCADSWPPFLAEDGAVPAAGPGVSGTLGTMNRGGGELQVTLNGYPLYHFAADAAPGDVNGEGVGEVWYVARPDGSLPGAGASEDPDPYY